MKILHISDLHIGKRLNDFLLNESIHNSLSQIIEYVKDYNIECILMSGDIYDKSLPSIESMNEFEWFLNELIKRDIYILIIPGNHDSKERLAYLNDMLRNHKVYIVCDKLEVVTIDEYDFYLMPYMSLLELKQMMNKEYKSKDEAYKDIFNIEFNNKHNVLLLHEYVAYPNLELSDSERPLSIGGSDYVNYEIFNKFDYVALGHIHKSQKITDKMYYSGSITKFSFSEEKNKNCVILLEDLKPSRLYLNDYLKLVTIKGNLNTLLSKEFYEKYNYETDIFRAIITDEDEQIGVSFKLKGIYKNLNSIEYTRVFKESRIQNDADKPIVELFKDFYNYIESKDLSSEDLNLVNELFDEIRGDELDNR